MVAYDETMKLSITTVLTFEYRKIPLMALYQKVLTDRGISSRKKPVKSNEVAAMLLATFVHHVAQYQINRCFEFRN